MVDINAVKSRLRISHSLLDDQFAQDIEAAKAELVRIGVSNEAVEDANNPLIDKAIISYCMWIESSSDKMAEKYEMQWNLWKDELRKSSGFRAGNV